MACSCIYDQYDLNNIYRILFIEQSELLNVQDASMHHGMGIGKQATSNHICTGYGPIIA